MPFAASRRNRLLLLLGALLILLGGLGFWLSSEDQRSYLSPNHQEILNVNDEDFRMSFVVAGRDIMYLEAAQDPIYDDRGRIVGYNDPAQSSVYGTNTDTIFFVQMIRNRLYLFAIPRDVYLEEAQTRINAIYNYEGAEGLRREVSNIVNLPVDYHLVLNIDIFKRVVDAIGGVDVYVPERMFYVDNAAQLRIDLEEGEQHLDGEAAAGFVRFRETALGDYSRLDNIKTLANAMLARVKALNIRAASTIPELIDIYAEEVETDLPTNVILTQILPRLNDVDIVSRTLPTYSYEVAGQIGGVPVNLSVEGIDPEGIDRVLANAFGGEAPSYNSFPEVNLLISNRSGIDDLGNWMRKRLLQMGFPSEYIFVRDAASDPSPTRLHSTHKYIEEAAYFADLFNVSEQQVSYIDSDLEESMAVELILGQDVKEAFYGVRTLLEQHDLDSAIEVAQTTSEEVSNENSQSESSIEDNE